MKTDNHRSAAGSLMGIVHCATDSRVRFTSRNSSPAVVADFPGATGRLTPRLTLGIEMNDRAKISNICLVAATRKLTAIG